MATRTLKSYLYEALVIVGSILIAFGLDAAWANHQDSKAEQRMLAELQGELQSAKARILSSIGELENVLAASGELATFLGNNAPPLTSAAAEDLLGRITDMNTLEVPTSALDSVIASGQARLISNKALLRALAEWPAFILDVRENHDWHRVETDEYLIPYLAQFVSVRTALFRGTQWAPPPGNFDYDVTTLQRDPVFEGRLAMRMSRQSATLRESVVLLDETEKLLAMVESEIH